MTQNKYINLGDYMSRLLKIVIEDKEGNIIELDEAYLKKDGGIKGAYKKGKEILDCVIYFDEPINEEGLCSKRFKYNFLFDEKVDLIEGQMFCIGDTKFQVIRKKECFSECSLVKSNLYCSLRSAVFIKALEEGTVKINDKIK